MHPDECLGVIDTVDHAGLAIESLQYTGDKRFIGTLTHDLYIRLFAASILDGDENGRIQCAMEETKDGSDGSDDRDSEASDGSDGDSEQDEDCPPRKGRKRVKTEAERFFDDL